MARTNDKRFVWLSAVLIGSVFIADIHFDLGAAASIPYVAVVLIALWSRDKHDIFLFTILVMAFALLAMFTSPEGIGNLQTIFKNSIAFVIILLAAIIGFNYRVRTERIEVQGSIDNLTGLFNRRGFFGTAENFIKFHPQTAFLIYFLDINNMKTINDEQGHNKGDEAIVKMSEVLIRSFRGADIIGRFGGDEFVVMVPRVKENQDDLFRKRIKTFMEITKADKLISVSIGHVFHDPEFSKKSLPELIEEADKNMYSEKRKSS